jgi:CheY-like chemotaxis protein
MQMQVKNKPANILVVDDVPANLLALRALLDSPDYFLEEASSGFEALEKCEHKKYDLIILDIQMPGIDGYETASRIKHSARNHDAPIIFVTALSSQSDFGFKGRSMGAEEVLQKPLEPDEFKRKVGIYVTKNPLH